VGITVLSCLCSRPRHLLELLAGWDALQHGCIVNLTGVDNKAFCDPETGSDRLLSAISRELEHPLSQPVAKVICLLQYVKSVHRTAENIAAALHPSAAGDSQLAAVKVHDFVMFSLGHKNLTGVDTVQVGERVLPFEALGLSNTPIEDTSGTSAYHIPEGCLVIYDPQDRAPKSGRAEISTCELAPTLPRALRRAAARLHAQASRAGMRSGA